MVQRQKKDAELLKWHGFAVGDKEKSFNQCGLVVRWDRKTQKFQCVYKIDEQYAMSYISEEDLDNKVLNDEKFFIFYPDKPDIWKRRPFINKLQDVIGYLGLDKVFPTHEKILHPIEASRYVRIKLT